MDSKLITIWQPIAEGSESIQEWWHRNGEYLQTITQVETDRELMIWSAGFYRYGMFLYNDGYAKQSLEYIDKAIEILDKNKGKLYENQFREAYETMTESKCSVLYRLEKYWEAYGLMKQLHSLKPEKDDYKIGMKNLLSAGMSKITTPLFIVLACIWGIMLLEQYVFHTDFIPSIVWTITWGFWIVLLIVQFVLPVVLYKIQK